MHNDTINSTHFANGADGDFPGKPRKDRRDLLKKRRIAGPPGQPSSGKPGGKQKWPTGHRIAFIILMVMLGLFLWKQWNLQTTGSKEVTYTQFIHLVEAGKLKTVRIQSGTLFGTLAAPAQVDSTATGIVEEIEVQIGVYDQAFVKDLVGRGIDVTIDPERTWMNILISTLPWILIFAVWIFILRQMQGGPKGVFSFGKSRARLMAENQPKVTFADVAGVEEAKQELQEIIGFLVDPRKYQRLGGKIPKGALLIGPPGTGKTLLARAVAGEAGVPFFSMSGSDFVEMFVGVGASRVRDLFEQGKTNAPCIIFIDEIDAVGRQRGAGIGGGHDEREQTLNQLLVEMDGFESNDGVILLAATNRPDVLDPALLRPGRFDRQIVVDWPDVKAREMILNVHVKNIQPGSDVNTVNIAKGTPGMTGADLANVVNEAALLAARLNHKKVMMSDFEEAKDKVMMGAARKTLVITDDEKRLTACHEAGHVLVSKYIPGADPVHKVSIVARGRALGLTHFLPSDERHSWSSTYCLGKLAVLLGGRAAESYLFGDITNGASNDIETATGLARKMICEWGMSKRLGPLSFGKKDSEIFLGREIATHKDYSEETAVAIDQEVRKLVESAQQRADTIIREHTEKLDALMKALLRHEVLADDQIEKVMSGESGRSRRNQPRVPREKSPDASEDVKTANVDVTSSGDDSSDGGTDTETPKRSSRRRRRSSSSRRRSVSSGEENGGSQRSGGDAAPESDAGHDKKAAKTPHAPGTESPPKSADNRQAKSNDADDGGNDSSGEDKGKAGSRKRSSERRPSSTRRKRMVRLKTGGRQRTIRKAPAREIREVN